MTVLGVVLYSLFFGFLTAYIALRKGYDTKSWFWLGILLGLVATVILLLQPNKKKEKHNVSNTISK